VPSAPRGHRHCLRQPRQGDPRVPPRAPPRLPVHSVCRRSTSGLTSAQRWLQSAHRLRSASQSYPSPGSLSTRRALEKLGRRVDRRRSCQPQQRPYRQMSGFFTAALGQTTEHSLDQWLRSAHGSCFPEMTNGVPCERQGRPRRTGGNES
jgi:hypothetical protein